jgi:ABC-type antimicrobial peptide transport system permease subunit
LKTLGFLRAQVRRTVTWQATTVAAIAVAAGMPLGIAAGRSLWNVVATELGTHPEPVTPEALLVLVPGALAVAYLVAALPARLASRISPALALRAE